MSRAARLADMNRSVTGYLCVIVIGVHGWLQLPVMSRGLFVAVYLMLAVLLVAIPYQKKRLLFPLAAVLVVLPVVGTLAIGLNRFMNLDPTGPGSEEPAVPTSSMPGPPLLVHLSDTHFVGSDRTATKQGLARDAARLKGLVARLIDLHPRYVIVTGDITDTGRETEWLQADEILFEPLRVAGISVMLAPGNHDLQPAFGGTGLLASIENSTSVLQTRFLQRAATARPDLASTDGQRTASRLPPDPTADKIKKEADETWRVCNDVQPFDRDVSPVLQSEACQVASDPMHIKERLMGSSVAAACHDWYPLVTHDAEAALSFIMLCSSANVTDGIGANAVGAWGSGQLIRLAAAFQHLPAQTRHVVILVHHAPVRRRDDRFGGPRRWWSWQDWNNSPIYNFALLGAEWTDAIALVATITAAAKEAGSPAIAVLYGHRHQQSFSGLASLDGWTVRFSEAPAFGETAAPVRAAYGVNNGAQLVWKSLQF